MTVPLWTVDGFVGVLTLVIYNFLLYILAIILGIGGIIKDLEQTMGYFLLNSFIDFGFSAPQMIIGLIFTLGISYLLGMGIGKLVRIKNKKMF